MSRSSSLKSWLCVIVVVLLTIVFIAGTKAQQIAALINFGKENSAPPPIAVSSAQVERAEWERTISAIGSLEAAKGLLLTADVAGRVAKIHFEAGQFVKQGDLLIAQDTSTEQAQLRAAQATASLAKSNLERVRSLYKKRVASKSAFDREKSTYQAAIAEVDSIRAIIAKKSIRAPFSGKLGIRLVNLGQSIDAGEPLVSLQAIDAMFVNFFLPQQYLSKIKTGLTVRVSSDAVPDKQFEGKINAIDPEINSQTRSVRVQALLDNSQQQLLPGMFATLEIVLPTKDDVIMIPITAVNYASFGDSVFLVTQTDSSVAETVEENNTAEYYKIVGDKQSQEALNTAIARGELLIARQQFIKLGRQYGDFIAVQKGLSAGQTIVVAGAFKLNNGASILVNNDIQPDYQLMPKVKDQ